MYDTLDLLTLREHIQYSSGQIGGTMDQFFPSTIHDMGMIFGHTLVLDFFLEHRLDNYTIIENVQYKDRSYR